MFWADALLSTGDVMEVNMLSHRSLANTWKQVYYTKIVLNPAATHIELQKPMHGGFLLWRRKMYILSSVCLYGSPVSRLSPPPPSSSWWSPPPPTTTTTREWTLAIAYGEVMKQWNSLCVLLYHYVVVKPVKILLYSYPHKHNAYWKFV